MMVTLPDNNPLLKTGKIYLIKHEVSGRYGIMRLYDLLSSNQLGFNWEPDEEVWVVMLNKKRNRLRILHTDPKGYDLTTRICYGQRFQVKFEQYETQPELLTRDKLRELIMNATY